ncbi:hypothetical protein ES332_D08G124200v1 [Gossypium tomentosum]|uniref:Uncharacterized protein n=1 Tax=Gossypium tomentosum TaxID=34277 RepID=A0A5D2JT02_GOSTO|nr:hypothetical protein ES332_D08G124200v1 [Gossypium tomentosum]
MFRVQEREKKSRKNGARKKLNKREITFCSRSLCKVCLAFQSNLGTNRERCR